MYNTSPTFSPRGLTRNAMYKRTSHTHSRNERGASGPVIITRIAMWIQTARYAGRAGCSILHCGGCSWRIQRYAGTISITTTKRAVVYSILRATAYRPKTRKNGSRCIWNATEPYCHPDLDMEDPVRHGRKSRILPDGLTWLRSASFVTL